MRDEVWADEGGIGVAFEWEPDGGVKVSIVEKSGRDDKVLASATISRWRWDRIRHATGRRD